MVKKILINKEELLDPNICRTVKFKKWAFIKLTQKHPFPLLENNSFQTQVSIFEASGSTIQPNVAAIILGVVNIVATIGANLCIDRVGRKVLLYISNTGMIISLTVFGAYFYMKDALTMDAPGHPFNLLKSWLQFESGHPQTYF